MANYLVTGAAGFIGSAIAKELLIKGNRVVTIDNLSTGYRDNIPNGTIFIEGDCGDSLIYDKVPKIKFDAIFHNAGQSSGEISFDDPIYDINQIQSNSYNANKTKLKTPGQYIAILYANLFQQALSANELVEITRCIESVGDKEIVHEVIISNFMNKTGVTIPSDSLMRVDLNSFIEETYKRFYVRDITEAEREYFLNFFESHPNVSSEMVYTAFSLSNEYQFY